MIQSFQDGDPVKHDAFSCRLQISGVSSLLDVNIEIRDLNDHPPTFQGVMDTNVLINEVS